MISSSSLPNRLFFHDSYEPQLTFWKECPFFVTHTQNSFIFVSSPIISSRVSLGFCEKKRWKESEWKHQRYHIRTSHQYIFHILYSASKCISCSTLASTVCIVYIQCSFEECIYRFQQERRGAKYAASSAPVSLLHPRHWAIQDEVNQPETHSVSE